MSPVAIRDDDMGARPSGMARAYGAAWAGTGRNRSIGSVIELVARDSRPTVQLFHDYLTEHLGRYESGPVDRWCVGQDALELVTEFLGEQVTLATTRRTTVPVVVGRVHAVIDGRE